MINGREIALKNGGLRHGTLHKDAKEYILKYETGQTWSRKIGEATKRRYFIEMFKVCTELSMSPDELLAHKFKSTKKAESPLEARATENMLEKLIYEKSYTLMTKSALISFFKNNDFPLKPSFMSEMEQKEKAPEEYKVIEDVTEVLKIEKVLQSIRDVAILWFLESTGMRRGSLKTLTWGDLKPTGNEDIPYYVELKPEQLKGKGRGKYRGVRQITFVHWYAREKLNEYRRWLHKWKRYIYDSQRRPIKKFEIEIADGTPLFVSMHLRDGKLRPLDPNSFYRRLTDAIILSKGNGVEKTTPHDFRRFVESSLTKTNTNQKLIDLICAHKPKRRDIAYVHADWKELLLVYKKALPYLAPDRPELIRRQREALSWFPPSMRPVQLSESENVLVLAKQVEEMRKHNH